MMSGGIFMGLFQARAEVRQGHEGDFDIVNAFQSLSPNRQIVICDQLFYNQRSSFKNTLNLLFPETNQSDVVRLEKFLRTRVKRP